VLWIGVFPGLTPEMLDYVIATLRDFVRQALVQGHASV
jgi:dTDP-4-amino-4,6-dideoxygalactose transaminase